MADIKQQVTTSVLSRRVSELELELESAQRTIEALLDRVERTAEFEPHDGALFEAAARLEHEVERRTRESNRHRKALEKANAELRELSSTLDKVVRNRTRALVESEAQLQQHVDKLNRLNEERREFIAIAAHELRTPLTVLLGYSEMIASGRCGEPPTKMGRPLEQIGRSADRMRRLVEQMLDVSHIDSGHIALRAVPVRLRDVLAESVERVEPQAAENGVTLETSVSLTPEDAGELSADPERVDQIVDNLLLNAIKLGRDGSVVQVTLDNPPPERYSDRWLRLRVEHHGGPGSSKVERSFEPFAQADVEHHTSALPDSAGLGLFIARRLVELHGGVVGIDVEGRGEATTTTITILLPRP